MIHELHGSRETVLHTKSSLFTLYLNQEYENYPSHWHSEVEIIYPIQNIYTVIIQNHSYTLQPGDIMVLPSGAIHQLIAPDNGSRMILQISHAIVREVNGFDSVYSRFFPCAVFRAADDSESHKEMIRLLERITLEYQDQHALWEASIHGMIIQFFVLAGRACISQADAFPHRRPKRQEAYVDTFFNICTYINNHCTESLLLSDVAQMAGFSKAQFIRLFKEYSGVSFYEYLTRRRLLRADVLLCELDSPIADIAMNSGFNSLATFNRVFKNSHHCTPLEYRRQHQTH